MNWQRNSTTGTEPENNLIIFFPRFTRFQMPFYVLSFVAKALLQGYQWAVLLFCMISKLILCSQKVMPLFLSSGEKKNHNMRGEMIGIIRLNRGIQHNGKNIFYVDHLSTYFCSLNDVLFCSGKQIHLIKSKTQMAAVRKNPYKILLQRVQK